MHEERARLVAMKTDSSGLAAARDDLDEAERRDLRPCHEQRAVRSLWGALEREFYNEEDTEMTILVYGAGVLGSVYAARLHDAGHTVSILARDQRLADLRAHGIVLD
ncbi:MAG: hypothetical protein M3Y74_23020, partial [Chloroflexota bacterium]|nr:hypothetical protein [Chloroflexota bacterium]